MDINQLLTFVTLVEEKNITFTAQKLYISPSTVTKHIQILEELTNGKKLFLNGHKDLTETGKLLYIYSKKILGLYSELDYKMEKINKFSPEHAKHITVGGSEFYIEKYFLPASIKFKKKYPFVKFEIQHLSSDDSFQLLSQNKLDMAITVGKQPTEDMLHTTIGFEDLVMVANKKLIKKHEDTENLLLNNIILVDLNSTFIKYEVEKYKLQFPNLIVCNSDYAIRKYLLDGLAIAIVGSNTYLNTGENNIKIIKSFAKNVSIKVLCKKNKLSDDTLLEEYYNEIISTAKNDNYIF